MAPNPTSEVDANNGKDAGAKNSKSKSKPTMPPNVGFVDLRANYDDVLMNRFYEEMMIPGFPDPDGSLSQFPGVTVGARLLALISCNFIHSFQFVF